MLRVYRRSYGTVVRPEQKKRNHYFWREKATEKFLAGKSDGKMRMKSWRKKM
jgi:hypothetical protein